jgi:DNA-binding CsgD family transcriptional regulator
MILTCWPAVLLRWAGAEVGRHIVLEGADPQAVADTARDAAAGDATLVTGWRVRSDSPRTVCVGTVADAEDAGRAVLAAVIGADVVVDARADREVIDRLCDDLRRLGTLEHRLGAAANPPVLTDDERALMARLLGGASLGESARALHLSRRTADRRLASARAKLGANSTSEAVVLAARAGIKPA